MAFRPSMRRHLKIQEIPLDIRPVMNLMVVLIPLLLSSAVFTKLAIRELNLPPAQTSGIGPSGKPPEEQKRIELKVLISKRGFYIASRSGYLTGGEAKLEAPPTVPLNAEGDYDYKELQNKLVEIKQKIQGQGFVDENSIIISAEADIPYKIIIKTIDYISTYTDENGVEQDLFPGVAIGQII